ncbi:hypothetical protein [Janibacter cremeus]|uniref:DUF2975 domain-containing protein n=1 Tax=Janibacter cremeus TaxID=1285192 RepID=A0A852VQN0_9MICO|nr:hypothetical protein [Janibacter cremeus]NYF97013.1 hypothetical protein [Janibacter cremeus]
MATRFQRDASASIFAFGLAGVALAVHVADTVVDAWQDDVVPIDVTTTDGQATTALVAIEQAPDWAVTTLRAAQVVEWILGALVLVLLTLCVVRMVRGEVFTRPTARVATWAGWTLLAYIGLPLVLRLVSSGEVLHAARVGEEFDVRMLSSEFWYLYVGMMAVSFLALVLRRGSRLQEDQEGLI